MKSLVNKFILASVAMAAFALTINTASAETVKVPFAFTAFGQNMPAGTYTVEQGGSSNLVYLRNNQSMKSYSWVTGPGAPDPTDKRVSLSFDTVGSTHVLRSIQYKSVTTSRLDKENKDSLFVPTRLSQGR